MTKSYWTTKLDGLSFWLGDEVASKPMSEMGFRADVTESQPAHNEHGGMRLACNRAQYSTERIAVMLYWEDYFDANFTVNKVVRGNFVRLSSELHPMLSQSFATRRSC